MSAYGILCPTPSVPVKEVPRDSRMPSRMEHEKVGLARVIELIRNSSERRYGHAVFIMDRVYPEDSTFLEAFIDQPEAQQYLEELRPHFGRRRLDWRIRNSSYSWMPVVSPQPHSTMVSGLT